MPVKTPSQCGRHTLLALAVASLAPVPSVYAQTEALVLEEILVTARKREESLMDAPLSVVAVGGAEMDAVGMTNMEQLSEQVPGLQLGRAAQTTNVFIRGIGSGINKGFEQSVGMYLDGVYQPRSNAFMQAFVDLQQVEVLRGPQSIMFGKNTVAGALKIESASSMPGDEFNGYLALDVEPQHATTRGTAVVSGSLTDTLAARLALRYEESDGYVENIPRDDDEEAREDSVARLSLVWQPTDDLQLTAKATRVDMDHEGTEATVPVKDLSYLQNPGNLTIVGYMGTIAAAQFPGFADPGGDYDGWTSNPNYYPGGTDTREIEYTQLSLAADWELGNYRFNSLTAWSDFKEDWNHDVDWHPGNVVHGDELEQNELWSQEFRVSSNLDGAFNYTAGVYYEEQETSLFSAAFLDGSLGGLLGGLPASSFSPALPPLPLSALGINSLFNGSVLAMFDPAAAALVGVETDSIARANNNTIDSQTLAVFLEFRWDITDSLSLELGGRYSEDEKKIHKLSFGGDGTPQNPNYLFNPDGSLTAAGLADPQRAALVGVVLGPLLSSYPHDQRLKRTEEHFDPSIKLLWNLDEDTMVYASYAQGYKSGGFNNSPDTANPDGSPGDGTEFEDEEATSYELGLRSSFLDGRGRLRATLFHTELEELQVTFFRGTEFLVGNAAEMTSRGMELDAEFAATAELQLGMSLAYLDSEFDFFPNAACTVAQIAASAGACFQDLGGRRGPFAPEWSGSLFANFSTAINDKLELIANLRLNYSDEMYLALNLDENALQDAYTKLSGRIALAAADGQWEVAVYGRNLTDETTHSFMFDSPASAGIYTGWVNEPRIVGVQARFSF